MSDWKARFSKDAKKKKDRRKDDEEERIKQLTDRAPHYLIEYFEQVVTEVEVESEVNIGKIHRDDIDNYKYNYEEEFLEIDIRNEDISQGFNGFFGNDQPLKTSKLIAEFKNSKGSLAYGRAEFDGRVDGEWKIVSEEKEEFTKEKAEEIFHKAFEDYIGEE